MRIFCAFECKLLEFQQPFLLSCAAHPNCSFFTFQRWPFTVWNHSCYYCIWWPSLLLEESKNHWAVFDSLDETSTSFVKPVMVKLVRTDHTSDPLLTKILAANNFKQTWAGVNRLLEWSKREEKDSDILDPEVSKW